MKKEYLVIGGTVIGVVVITGVGIIVYNQYRINQEAKKHQDSKLLSKATDIAKMNLYVIEQMIGGMSSKEAVDMLETGFGKALEDMGYNLTDLRKAVKRYDKLNKRGLRCMKRTLVETIGFNNRVIKAVSKREEKHAAKNASKAA